MSQTGRLPVHSEIAELLGAYALDALDPAEVDQVEAHLATCPRCAGEVARHHEVAGLLANTGADAPPELWDRIAENLVVPAGAGTWSRIAARLERPGGADPAIVEEPHTTGADEAPLREPAGGYREASGSGLALRRRTRWRVASWSGAALGAAAAIVAVVFGLQSAQLRNQVAQLQTTASQPGIARAANIALANPGTERVTLLPARSASRGGPSVTVALTRRGVAYLIPQNLAALPRDRTYQLWGAVDSRWISFGLLGAHPTTTAFSVAGNAAVTMFAITVEPASGVVQPTRAPVIEGSVPS
ncbi:MAG: anti-sigma factor domain-containing protein [Acidimicrobiales bacterium]